MTKLKFGKGNAKLDKLIHTFSLPAGQTCPGAYDCKSMAITKSDGRRIIVDGPHTQFRCFAASQEVLYTNTYRARQHNLNLLKTCGKGQRGQNKMTKLILNSLPKKTKYARIHVSGDFFSQTYFNSWLCVAVANPNILFYAYTKSLRFWVAKLGFIPSNFVLTASVGGKYDDLIDKHNLRSAIVTYSEKDAKLLGLKIDKDDSLAMTNGGDFALLLHGQQPKNSDASKALSKLRKSGKPGYNAKNKAKANLPVLNGNDIV